MAKISFPEHMRRLQAAIEALQELSKAPFIDVGYQSGRESGEYTITVRWLDVGKFATGDSVEEVGIKLSHLVAGRTEADVPPY